MPIVCNKTFNDNPEICNVVLEHMTPDDNACSNSLAYSDRQCSTILYNTSYLQTTIINITTSATDMYGVYGHFKVNLVVSPNRLNYKRFWSSAYKLPTIDVFVQPEADRSWRGKLCTAQNDPHMHTFDGRHYEHHEANGEYILYQHNLFENVQVQHKIASCVGLNGTAKCNCGVGVRSGRDVYVINVCDRLLDIGFKRCQDESLTVKKNNDFTYTIYLSYGTAIRARIDNQPWMGDEGGKVVDITISPTMYDHEGKSSGLCGTITSNKEDDFVLRNRSYGALNESDRQMFINSWKVKETESLFSENVYHMQLQPWHFPSCSCNPGKAANDTTTCDRTLSDCTPGMTSGQHSCGGVSAMRSVRSISTPLGIPVVMQTDHYSTIDRPRLIKKRNANLPLPGTMTPKEICTNYFKDLAAFALCNKIPATNTNISTENCEMDIQLTNSTAWLNISGQSMQDVCILEIHRNSSVRQAAMESAKNNSVLPEHAPHSIVTDAPVHLQEIQEIENIVKKIKDVSCLNNCSGNGHCASGTCLCMDGYGAADCSVDTKKPPRLVDIIHKGLCDEKDGNDCSYIYVFGEIFTATNLTCRLQKFTMKEGETREMHNIQSYIKGIHDSLIEAICPIENLRHKRSSGTSGLSPADFVYGFQVSMSNDGVHFGNETKDVFIFNSSCQTYSNTTKGMIFNIKAGFCHIEGRCISNGSLSVSQTMICDTDYSKFSWRILPSTTKLPSTTQATQSSSMKGSCTHGVCVCNTGWTGTLCENDIDECQGINTDICSSDSNTACQNIPGSFECLCLRGFVNTTGECKRSEVIDPRSLVEHKVNSNRNLQAFTIEIEIDMDVNSTTNINTSTTYKRFADAANISLSNVYQRTLGIAFKEVVILSLKTGSLFIEHAVITTKNEFSVTALSHVIAEWSTGGHIEMFNLTYSVKKITTEKGSVGEGDLLLCMSYTSIHPCAKDESCVIDNEKPVCKKQEVSSDNSKLVTIISSSVGVVLVLVICILIGCLCRRRTDRNKRLDNRNKSAQENPYHEFNSTEMLQRPRKTVEDDNCLSPPDPSVDNRSCKSGGTYYQSDDGYMYYFGKQ